MPTGAFFCVAYAKAAPAKISIFNKVPTITDLTIACGLVGSIFLNLKKLKMDMANNITFTAIINLNLNSVVVSQFEFANNKIEFTKTNKIKIGAICLRAICLIFRNYFYKDESDDYDLREELELVSLMISINEIIINTKGNIQINKGICVLKKCLPSMYLPRNMSNTKATVHCDAKPANLDH
jgi:hypothetical protein